jgi:hypothetical protein
MAVEKTIASTSLAEVVDHRAFGYRGPGSRGRGRHLPEVRRGRGPDGGSRSARLDDRQPPSADRRHSVHRSRGTFRLPAPLPRGGGRRIAMK